jgi:hypothetical protein
MDLAGAQLEGDVVEGTNAREGFSHGAELQQRHSFGLLRRKGP